MTDGLIEEIGPAVQRRLCASPPALRLPSPKRSIGFGPAYDFAKRASGSCTEAGLYGPTLKVVPTPGVVSNWISVFTTRPQ